MFYQQVGFFIIYLHVVRSSLHLFISEEVSAYFGESIKV